MKGAVRLCLAVCLFALRTLGQAGPGPQSQTPAQAQAPASPAAGADDAAPHDRHNGVTVSAKPCTDPATAKDKFGKANPLPVGILPVEVFLHNETNQPVRIDLSTVQLSVH